MKRTLYILLFILFLFPTLNAQVSNKKKTYYRFEYIEGERVLAVYLPEIIVFPKLTFKNEKERLEYTKLVRDVKITLPYAKQVAQSIIESYEMMETFETHKEKQKFLEDVQKYMMDTYKPKMKKLTKTQGKILVKLIDRECNTSSYDIVKSLVGSLKAGVYNGFAKLFGNNLKEEYDPEGKDKMIERIVILVEQGGI